MTPPAVPNGKVSVPINIHHIGPKPVSLSI
jgi:hypothetical protein